MSDDKEMRDVLPTGYSYISVWAGHGKLYSILRCNDATYEREIIADIDSLSAEENRIIAQTCIAALNKRTLEGAAL